MIFSIAPFETSNVLLLAGLLFLAGVAEDVLDTWVTFTVVKRQTALTAIITFVGIVLEFTVFLSFISNLDKWPVILAYALGATVGTVGVIETQKYYTRKKTERQKVLKTKAARRKRIAEYAKARKAKERLTKVTVAKAKPPVMKVVGKIVGETIVKPTKAVEKSPTETKKGDIPNEVK